MFSPATDPAAKSLLCLATAILCDMVPRPCLPTCSMLPLSRLLCRFNPNGTVNDFWRDDTYKVRQTGVYFGRQLDGGEHGSCLECEVWMRA